MIRLPSPTRGFSGFTLIELLVVISIIAVVVGISYPALRSMTRGSSTQMAANSITVAVSGARVYATQTVFFGAPVKTSGQPIRTAQDDGDGYSGAVVLVTPSNDLRILRNTESAVDTAGQVLELHPSGIRNGYDLIENVDAIRLPSNVVVLGIVRDSSGTRLLSAPFAISFNAKGTMHTRYVSVGPNDGEGYIYVSHDGERRGSASSPVIDITYGRDQFTSGSETLADYRRGEVDLTDDGLPALPFAKIEPVVGVVILDAREFESLYGPLRVDAYDALISEAIMNEAATKGRILFFNRYTGQNVAVQQ